MDSGISDAGSKNMDVLGSVSVVGEVGTVNGSQLNGTNQQSQDPIQLLCLGDDVSYFSILSICLIDICPFILYTVGSCYVRLA